MDDHENTVFLEMLLDGEAVRKFPLTTSRTVLGRHPSCGIVLDDGSVSRQHATITRTPEGEYTIEDHASRNRTFVNGLPILPNQPVSLRNGAVIRICSITLRFRDQNQFGPVEEDDSGTHSVVTSRLSVAGDPGSVRLNVNAEQKLRALIEISRNLGKAMRLDDVLPELLDSLFRIFPLADRGYIGCTDPQTGKLIPKTWKSRGSDTAAPRISRTIAKIAIESKEAILSTDAANDERFDMAASIVDIRLHSILCAPLVTADGRVLGLIQLDSTSAKGRFTDDDLDVLSSVAAQACGAVENALLHEMALQREIMRRELELGRQVQRGFLPSVAPQFPGYRFFHYYEAAKQVGGDYFDYIPLHGGRMAIVIADVSGKGISAALFTARLSTELRYCLAGTDDLRDAVHRLNNAFCSERKELEGRFITSVIVVLDPENDQIQFANAGHMNLIVRRPDGTTEEIGDEIVGPPLGIEADLDHQTMTTSLKPGEYVFLYTDGLCDAENAERLRYGYDRIHRVLGRTPFDELESSLLGDVRTHIGNQPHTDDMCIVAFARE
ncbi:MAG: SpoIIE family protein phosphatase [Planctomycetia bacterium]|nr:SpoIIE family protein phosphatase [Planctomycetia bacterium]